MAAAINLTLLFFILQFVSSTSFTPPIIRSETQTSNTSFWPSTIFTYADKEFVTLNCSVPFSTLKDIKFKMYAYNTDGEEYKFTSTAISKTQVMTMVIFYNSTDAPNRLSVKCEATSNKEEQTAEAYIKMEHKVTNVSVRNLIDWISQAGENISLACDSNGSPDFEYRWLNNSEVIENATSSQYIIQTPVEYATTGEYSCQSKNKHNVDYVKSNTITVTTVDAPYPTIESVTPTIKETDKKFTYLNTEKITLHCTVPPVLDNIRLNFELDWEPTTQTVFLEEPDTGTYNKTIEIKRIPREVESVKASCSISAFKKTKTTSIEIEQQFGEPSTAAIHVSTWLLLLTSIIVTNISRSLWNY